jgi:beta-glucosidase
VQLYVSALTSSVFRPALELQAFQKARDVKAGESRAVRLSLDRNALAYWDEKGSKWCVEEGKYRVSVGTSVEDLRLETLVVVEETFFWTGL